MGRWPWILSFTEKKKQNSNKAKGVGFMSVLAKVKNGPTAIMG
jgi:hypothetical protein